MKRRLDGWTKLLTADHIARGRLWYPAARTFCQEVTNAYHVPLDRVVGILAVLSVQNRWNVNKRDCENLCRAFHEGRKLETISVATYDGQKKKALAILRADSGADIAAMLGTRYAPKTRAFYDNIWSPGHSLRVTIDRWILRGLGLENSHWGSGGYNFSQLYRHLERLFFDAAVLLDLRACELQAAVWICIQETAAAEDWP